MKLRPMRGRLVVKLNAVVEKTSGGIIIPGDSTKQPTTGVIIAHGTCDKESGMTVGDTILFGKYAGTPVTLGGDTFTIMNISEILAVIEK